MISNLNKKILVQTLALALTAGGLSACGSDSDAPSGTQAKPPAKTELTLIEKTKDIPEANRVPNMEALDLTAAEKAFYEGAENEQLAEPGAEQSDAGKTEKTPTAVLALPPPMPEPTKNVVIVGKDLGYSEVKTMPEPPAPEHSRHVISAGKDFGYAPPKKAVSTPVEPFPVEKKAVKPQKREGTPIYLTGETSDFYLIEQTGTEHEPILLIKKQSVMGSIYSKRIFSCEDKKTAYLGAGETMAELAASKPDREPTDVKPGTAAWQLMKIACH